MSFRVSLYLIVSILASIQLTLLSEALPVEALQVLQSRSVPLGGRSAKVSGALVTEFESPRLKRAAERLPTSVEGLERVLTEGTQDDGIISSAISVTACRIATSAGRRVAILNGRVQVELLTEFTLEVPSQMINSTKLRVLKPNPNAPITSPGDKEFILLDDYPFENLRAQSVSPEESRVRQVDEDKVTDASYVSDLREVCDQRETIENRVVAEGEKNETFDGFTAKTEPQLAVENPYARLANHTGVVNIRYDTYEVVLQSVAVALLLLDLFILDDFQSKKVKFYHVLGIVLLAAATIITVVMGYFQVLRVLDDESFAFMSCGSYNFRAANQTTSTVSGLLYVAHCEWGVVRAESTRVSYLIMIPSAIGGVLLLVLVIRFSLIKYRRHRRNIYEIRNEDEETKIVREREEALRGVGGQSGTAGSGRGGFLKKLLGGTMALVMVCDATAQQFPPTSVELVGANFVANGEVLYLAGVAVASPWRCTWESREGPADDATSIARVDDCFARWAPPTEDDSTSLLYGQGSIKFERCSPEGKRCPFTGTRCKATDRSFDCTNNLKNPGPINFLPESKVRGIDRWCSWGSPTSKAFCKIHFIRRLAYQGLHLLTSEIKTKLGDEKVNVHRISEYVFPDCAGPPRNLSGSDAGISTGFVHFSMAGDDCRNSRSLEVLARKRSRKLCQERLALKKDVCRGRYWLQKPEACKRRWVRICTDAMYISAVVKSRFMRAADDWLVSRCHQGGLTKEGRLKNWVANEEAVVSKRIAIPKDPKTDLPFIRPVRQGWVFNDVPLA